MTNGIWTTPSFGEWLEKRGVKAVEPDEKGPLVGGIQYGIHQIRVEYINDGTVRTTHWQWRDGAYHLVEPPP